MSKRTRTPTKAELTLGAELARLRRVKGVGLAVLARQVRETEQQITRYEAGAFVPLPVLESLAEALGEPIAKRDIRRISLLRKKELAAREEIAELAELYARLFEAAE